MEQEGDFSVTVPLIFTALAVILATVLIKLFSGGEKQPAEAAPEQEKEDQEVVEAPETEEKDKEDKIAEDKEAKRTEREAVPVEDIGTADELPQSKDNEPGTEECAAKESPSSHSSQEEEDSKEDDFETESDKILKIKEADDADDDELTFKYVPGQLRGSEFEKMLTKDELEEEQRIELTSDLTSL